MRSNAINNEIEEVKKYKEKIKRKVLIYKANKYKYHFQQYETIRSFARIYIGKINTDKAEMDQSNLLNKLVQFYQKSRPRAAKSKGKREKYF